MNEYIAISTVVVGICYALMIISVYQEKYRAAILLWWPLALYVPGALAAYFLFADHSIFMNYFSPESISILTIQFSLGFLTIFLMRGKLAGMIVGELMELQNTPSNKLFDLFMVLIGLICIVLQFALMYFTGASIFSNSYVLGDGNFAENSALFTLSAGFYEIFTSIWAIDIARGGWRKEKKLFYLFYALVLLFRIIGGTRLILLKLIIFVLLLRLIQGQLGVTRLLLLTFVATGFFGIIGFLRGSDTDSGSNIVFLLLAEPALGNLSATYVIDFYKENSDFIKLDFLIGLGAYAVFIAIHLIPNFMYQAAGGSIIPLGDWGFYRSWAEPFYPFGEILKATGLETISPVGGQSIIALGTAIFGVVVAFFIIPLIIMVILKVSRMLKSKVPVILVFAFEAPSLYRDSSEIFFKQMFVVIFAYIIIAWSVKFFKRLVNVDRKI